MSGIIGEFQVAVMIFSVLCIICLLHLALLMYFIDKTFYFSGRAETVRSALDVLAIACIMPKVQILLCDRVDLPEESAVGKTDFYVICFISDNFRY